MSEPDKGQALCGAPVRFEEELRNIRREQACDLCLLRADLGAWEFMRPGR